MSRRGTYGTTVEILAAAQLYSCTFIIYIGGRTTEHHVYGQGSQEFELKFSGQLDSGHYDVLRRIPEMYVPN